MTKKTGWKKQISSLLVLLLPVIAAGIYFVKRRALKSKAASETNGNADTDKENSNSAVARTKYHGWDAWSLNDGETEAIVVPAIGRVMSFRRVGGDEWLWSAVAEWGVVPRLRGWMNWGGDKTWLAPQDRWAEFSAQGDWPPIKEWEGDFDSEILPDGKLKIWSVTSPVTGLQISRVFYHNDAGEFVIEQTVQQSAGEPIEAAIWNITQINNARIDAVFLPRAKISDYDSGFRWMLESKNVEPENVTPTLIQVPPAKDAFKIGTDSPIAAIAAVYNGWAFLERASRPDGAYTDGDEGKSGVPVQLYGHDDLTYLELELLSPLLQFKPGERHTHTVQWSLHKLPTKDVSSAEMHAAIESLMNGL